jgi:serine/threonine-protein phosphatase 2B catalytic subunit
LEKYDEETYDLIMDCFDSMPIAGLVAGKYFAVHGGIGPELKNIIEIDKVIDRFQEIPKSGLFCDLMWADPVEDEDSDTMQGFYANDERNCSVLYGL